MADEQKICSENEFYKLLKDKTLNTDTNLLKTIEESETLYNNGKFYYTSGESIGALVSYSCCAVLLNSVLNGLNGSPATPTPPATPTNSTLNVIDNESDTDSQTGDNSNESSDNNDLIKKTSLFLQSLLQVISKLQQQTNSKKGKGDDDDDEKDWDEICTRIKPLVFKKGGSDCLFYSDVIGLKSEKKTIDSSLIYPLIYPNLYPKSAKGILIYGPPGTGKTYLVKAAVNELQKKDPKVGVLFFAPSPGDLKGKYVGETEKRIEEIFVCASKAACKHEKGCPDNKKYISIIFMDEMDAIAPDRDTDTTGLAVNSVNTLLQMMDGIKSKSNVCVVAATNYPWNLDGALLRRFDSQLLINIPSQYDLKELLNMYMNKHINVLSSDKASSKVCDDEDKRNDKDDGDELSGCNLVCEDTLKSTTKYLEAPYNRFTIDYFDNIEQNGLIDSIVTKLHMNNFSNSDLDRLYKAAAVNSGELAVKRNLFYSPKILGNYDDTLGSNKFVSALTPFKILKHSGITPTPAVKGKVSIDSQKKAEICINALKINKYINSQNDGAKSDPNYIQLDPAKVVRIPFKKDYYYNDKCLLWTNTDILSAIPNVKNIYIKGHTIGDAFLEKDYIENILGTTQDNLDNPKLQHIFNSIDLILEFDMVFKETNIEFNRDILLPIDRDLINDVFMPIYKQFETHKTGIENSRKLQIDGSTGPTKYSKDQELIAPVSVQASATEEQRTGGENEPASEEDFTNITIFEDAVDAEDASSVTLSNATKTILSHENFKANWLNSNLLKYVQGKLAKENNMDYYKYVLLKHTTVNSANSANSATGVFAIAATVMSDESTTTSATAPTTNNYINFILLNDDFKCSIIKRANFNNTDKDPPEYTRQFTLVKHNETIVADIKYDNNKEIVSYTIKIADYIKMINFYDKYKGTDADLNATDYIQINKQLFEVLFINDISDLNYSLENEQIKAIYNQTDIEVILTQLYINNCMRKYSLEMSKSQDKDTSEKNIIDMVNNIKIDNNIDKIVSILFNNLYTNYLDVGKAPANAAATTAAVPTSANTGATGADGNPGVAANASGATVPGANVPGANNTNADTDTDTKLVFNPPSDSYFGKDPCTELKKIVVDNKITINNLHEILSNESRYDADIGQIVENPTEYVFSYAAGGSVKKIKIPDNCLDAETIVKLNAQAAKKKNQGGSGRTYKNKKHKNEKHKNGKHKGGSKAKTVKNIKNTNYVDNDVIKQDDSFTSSSRIYVGGATDNDNKAFIEWCNKNKKSGSTNGKIASVANKSIFIKTKFNYSEVSNQYGPNIVNRLYNIGNMTGFSGWWNTPTNTSNDVTINKHKEQFNAHLQKIKDTNIMMSILFKHITDVGSLDSSSNNTNITDDEQIISESNNIIITWSDTTNINSELSSIGTMLIDMIKLTKGLYISGAALVGPAASFTGAGALVGVGITASYLSLSAVLAGKFYEWNGNNENDRKLLINDTMGSLLYTLLMDIRFVETKKFKGISAIGSIFATLLYTFEATTMSMRNHLKQDEQRTGLWSKFTKMDAIDYTKLINTSTDDALPQNNNEIVLNTVSSTKITPEQKKQLVNLNIPLSSFYHALSIIQSTYNKETGPLLTKYYENRDLFMEDWKKRKEKK